MLLLQSRSPKTSVCLHVDSNPAHPAGQLSRGTPLLPVTGVGRQKSPVAPAPSAAVMLQQPHSPPPSAATPGSAQPAGLSLQHQPETAGTPQHPAQQQACRPAHPERREGGGSDGLREQQTTQYSAQGRCVRVRQVSMLASRSESSSRELGFGLATMRPCVVMNPTLLVGQLTRRQRTERSSCCGGSASFLGVYSSSRFCGGHYLHTTLR